MNVLIREANKNDLKSISVLLQELIQELIQKLDDTNGMEQNGFLDNLEILLKNKNNLFFVAETDKKIVGFMNINLRETCLHSSFSALIDEVVVKKGYRNQEIGRKFIEFAIKRCKEMNCSEMEVATEKDNFIAIGFYKNLGFKEIGVFLEMDL